MKKIIIIIAMLASISVIAQTPTPTRPKSILLVFNQDDDMKEGEKIYLYDSPEKINVTAIGTIAKCKKKKCIIRVAPPAPANSKEILKYYRVIVTSKLHRQFGELGLGGSLGNILYAGYGYYFTEQGAADIQIGTFVFPISKVTMSGNSITALWKENVPILETNKFEIEGGLGFIQAEYEFTAATVANKKIKQSHTFVTLGAHYAYIYDDFEFSIGLMVNYHLNQAKVTANGEIYTMPFAGFVANVDGGIRYNF